MKRAWIAIVAIAALRAQGLTDAQARTIEEARSVALNYSYWLPDLICAESIQRDMDWGATGVWRSVDRLTAQVTYFERKESYQLTARNNHSANQRLENLPGAVSKGEFGSMLRWIFDPEAKAGFEWERAERIRKRSVSVFAYQVGEANSRLELAALSHSVIAGFHGLIYVDDETHLVLRLTAETEGPEHFPIRESYVEIDYDWAEINGQNYLVPVHAETRMTESVPPTAAQRPPKAGGIPEPASCIPCDVPLPRAGADAVETRYRNRIEFHHYRKFTTDSTLKFGGDAQVQKVK